MSHWPRQALALTTLCSGFIGMSLEKPTNYYVWENGIRWLIILYHWFITFYFSTFIQLVLALDAGVKKIDISLAQTFPNGQISIKYELPQADTEILNSTITSKIIEWIYIKIFPQINYNVLMTFQASFSNSLNNI